MPLPSSPLTLSLPRSISHALSRAPCRSHSAQSLFFLSLSPLSLSLSVSLCLSPSLNTSLTPSLSLFLSLSFSLFLARALSLSLSPSHAPLRSRSARDSTTNCPHAPLVSRPPAEVQRTSDPTPYSDVCVNEYAQRNINTHVERKCGKLHVVFTFSVNQNIMWCSRFHSQCEYVHMLLETVNAKCISCYEVQCSNDPTPYADVCVNQYI